MNLTNLIAWIIVGAIGGWIGSSLMGSKLSLVYNIILGIIGGFVGGFVLDALGFGVNPGGLNLASIVASVVGAIILIAVARMLRRA
jgi:uncharacterized membrane protein YeaQ/YmgE (transglycosylase-associated protein family)